uniref:Cytochrome b5 type B n=1 Tax=Myotis myotis TaxID=51298 RepID=A0A7J7SAR7_MYOMY|nr:cytochrome b5 type B [Myotis myotis]
MLKQYYIGDVHPNDLKPESGSKDPSKNDTCRSCWSYWIFPIIGAILLGFLYRYYYPSESKGPPSSEPYSRSTCSLFGVLANVSCLHWFSRASLYFIVFC